MSMVSPERGDFPLENLWTSRVLQAREDFCATLPRECQNAGSSAHPAAEELLSETSVYTREGYFWFSLALFDKNRKNTIRCLDARKAGERMPDRASLKNGIVIMATLADWRGFSYQ